MLISACLGSTPGPPTWISAVPSLPRVTGRGGSGIAARPASGLCGTRRAVRRNIVDAAPATVAALGGGGVFATAGGGFGGSGRSSTGNTRVIAGSIADGKRGCSSVLCGRGAGGGGAGTREEGRAA